MMKRSGNVGATNYQAFRKKYYVKQKFGGSGKSSVTKYDEFGNVLAP